MICSPCRKYMVYLEDRDYVYKAIVPAIDEEGARNYVAGNGNIIAIKDATDDPEYKLDTAVISNALQKAGLSKYQIDLLIRALIQLNISD